MNIKQGEYPIARRDELVTQELKSEVLVYDLKINKVFLLNETSVLIWQLCNGDNSVEEIGRLLSLKLKSPVPEELVWLALEDLKKENLLANGRDIKINYHGLSRREVIRKVGVATMIALPFVASLVAPQSIIAQSSCLGLGGDCANSDLPCCPGLFCPSVSVLDGCAQAPCKQAGFACMSTAECCSDLTCQNNICQGSGGCLPLGARCSGSALPCCTGLICPTVSVLDGCEPCRTNGQTCGGINGECCLGFTCSNGTCVGT